jgi:hypothetical protein
MNDQKTEFEFKLTRASEIKLDLKSRHRATLERLTRYIGRVKLLREEIRSSLFAYGFWKLANGDIVVFNRQYVPMFHQVADGRWQTVKGQPWYDDIVDAENFYHDGHSELQKRRRSIAGMKRLGLIA